MRSPVEERRLADEQWLTHSEFILRLTENGWSRADAEVCWKEAEVYEPEPRRET
jgi:hypothetical protein